MGALVVLALLAGWSVIASQMLRVVAWPAAAAVIAYGLWLARRESGKPVKQFVWPGSGAAVTLDGEPLERVLVQWRSPSSAVSWQGEDGRRQRLHWWPDTLSAAHRRELRLAASPTTSVSTRPSMSP